MLKTLKAAGSLSKRSARIVMDRLLDGHIGQGLDLFWTYHTATPTEEEYFAMVDGSKFWLISRFVASADMATLRNGQPLHPSGRIDAF